MMEWFVLCHASYYLKIDFSNWERIVSLKNLGETVYEKIKKSAEIPILKFTKSISPHPLFFIADKDGLAVKNGINPKIELSDDLESIITGKNDAKLNDLIPPLVSAATGADLVIFAGSMTGGHILFANKEVAEELKIRAIRDIFYYRIF